MADALGFLSADARAALEQLIDQRVAKALDEIQADARVGSDWIYGDRAAAQHLGWPVGRVQKLSGPRVQRLPVHKIGQRKAYRRSELDRVLAEYSEGPL